MVSITNKFWKETDSNTIAIGDKYISNGHFAIEREHVLNTEDIKAGDPETTAKILRIPLIVKGKRKNIFSGKPAEEVDALIKSLFPDEVSTVVFFNTRVSIWVGGKLTYTIFRSKVTGEITLIDKLYADGLEIESLRPGKSWYSRYTNEPGIKDQGSFTLDGDRGIILPCRGASLKEIADLPDALGSLSLALK